jgi:ligand-binding sensor domain-containing protein
MFLWTWLGAQELHFKNLDMAKGLSSNNVSQVCVDGNGSLIIASLQGVSKYDGRKVAIYKSSKYKNFHLVKFSQVVYDSVFNILACSSKELYQIDANNDIKLIPLPMAGLTIDRLINTTNYGVLIKTNIGWFRLNRKYAFSTFSQLNILTNNVKLSSISIVGDDLVGVSKGNVLKYNIAKREKTFETNGLDAKIAKQLTNGNLMVGSSIARLHLIDGKSGNVISEYNSEGNINNVIIKNMINDLIEIDPHTIAYTTEDNGMYVLNLTSGKQEHYLPDNNVSHTISSAQSTRLYNLGNGNFVVASLFAGIDFFNIKRYFITQKEWFVDNKNYKFKSYINSIAKDKKDNLWIGTTDRVIRHNLKSNESKFFFYDEQYGIHAGDNTLLGFFSVFVDREGKIWKGSHRGGIIVYDPQNNNTTYLTKNQNQKGKIKIPSNYLYHITQDKKGTIWAATSVGFLAIDPHTFSIQVHTNMAILDKIPIDIGRYIHDDGHDNLWFCTAKNGLYKYNYKKATLDSFKFTKYAGSDFCYQVKQDKNGNTYVALGNGFVLIKANGSIHHFSQNNGLRNRVVEDFLFDSIGNAYIANHNHIVKFNPNMHSFKYYDNHYGIGNISFKSNSAFKIDETNMLWGTEAGYISFNPIAIEQSYIVPNLIIEDVQDSKGEKHNSKIPIKIDIGESLKFVFSSIDYFGTEDINFQYLLEGRDNDWQEIVNGNSISISGLKKGTYLMKIRSTINGSDWTMSIDKPQIIVSIPLLKNTLFHYFIILSFFSALIAWFMYKQKQNEKEADLKHQLTLLEVRAIRAQMNPHFVFNALNSIQYFTFSGDVDRANEYLGDFAKLMRLVLQQSKDGFINLENEIELLTLYLKIEALRFNNDFTYVVHKNLDDVEHIIIPSMIIQPFVENAIKHGLLPKKGEKKLEIVFIIKAHTLECHVIDNGIGMSESKILKDKQNIVIPHQSMGMDLVKNRLSLINDKEFLTNISVGENDLGGTTVKITLPI